MRLGFRSRAIWESPALGLRYENPASFVEMLRSTVTLELLIQTPHAPVINLTGSDQAQATTTIHERMRGVTPVDSAALDVESEARSTRNCTECITTTSPGSTGSGSLPTGCSFPFAWPPVP